MNKLSRKEFLKGTAGGLVSLAALGVVSSLGAAAEAKSSTVEVTDFDGGTLTLTLTVEDGVISAVDVRRSTETATVGDEAVALLPGRIVEANSPAVDIVAGATYTSQAILGAAGAALAQLGAGDEGNLRAWAEANGYVLAEDYRLIIGVDAVASATASGADTGLNFGFISFEQEDLGRVTAELLAGPYTWGSNEPKNVRHKAEDYIPGTDLTGLPQYRDMYVMGTACNNIPNTATLELVYDPHTALFYGSSEAGTSKVQEFRTNPYVVVTWVTQMTKGMFDQLGAGYPAYSDYGKLHSVMAYGRIHVLSEEDFDGGEREERALRALDVYMPTYYGTRWAFKTIDPSREYSYEDPEERAAKVAAAKAELAGVSAKYYIEPYRITVSLFSTFAPFKISESSAWSTYKAYSIKTAEAGEGNGYTESWQGITKDQYCQAAIARTPGSVNAGLRYWYESDVSWNFTWSQDGRELLAVEELKEGGNPVPYATPYKYRWVRDSFVKLTGELRAKWAEANQATLIEKGGEDTELSFTRKVLLKETAIEAGSLRAAGEVVSDEEIQAKGLVLGTDYVVQQLSLPNYTHYALTCPYAMSGIRSQQNYTPYPEANPVQEVQQDSAAEFVLPEDAITDGSFVYSLLEDGSYEIAAYAIREGQGLIIEIPAAYEGIAVTSIGKNAFKDLSNLVRITVPDTVTIFKEGAFYGVRSLKHLHVPASVAVIEKDCFTRTGWGNMNVDSFCIVEFASPSPAQQDLMMGEETVGLDGTQVRLKVPTEAAVSAYQAAWPGYAELISKDWVNPE